MGRGQLALRQFTSSTCLLRSLEEILKVDSKRQWHTGMYHVVKVQRRRRSAKEPMPNGLFL
jgi:hypothetical protein